MKFFKNSFIFLLMLSVVSIYSNGQSETKNKGKFIEKKNEFWEEIKTGIDEFNKKDTKKKLSYVMDFDDVNIPKSEKDFYQQWHNPPISQGSTGTCWCFCSTSFFETEAFRINKTKIKLSEMFTVYWQYVEKARRFVRERGESEFGEGAQANATKEMYKQYGCVPASAYSGMKPGQKFHDHSKMFGEMRTYLNKIKELNIWNEEAVIANIKAILNYYLLVPPTTFDYEGKSYTPKEFLENYIKLNPDDYVDVMSLLELGYWKKILYDVPDNWWKDTSYNNVPLDDYMSVIKKAIKKGYTMDLGGDVSEAGIESHLNVAMVPSFDIPSSYIDEYARQFRFSNNTTTDDHGIHLVGYKEEGGKTWFLIKDSGSGAKNGKAVGYYFFHEDYIKLKIMSIFIHKSAVEDILKKVN